MAACVDRAGCPPPVGYVSRQRGCALHTTRTSREGRPVQKECGAVFDAATCFSHLLPDNEHELVRHRQHAAAGMLSRATPAPREGLALALIQRLAYHVVRFTVKRAVL